MKRNIIFLLVIAITISVSGIAYGEYYYYYPDGSQKYQNVYDTLIAVGFRGFIEPEADMYAIEHSYLQNDFKFRQIPGDFTVFGIESGYSLDSAMRQIREESGVYMVNPVVIGIDSTPVYATNQAVAYFNSNITAAQIDSLNEIFHFSVFATVGTDSMYYYLEYTDSTEGSIFDICNEYYETGMVRYIYPHFVYKFQPEGEPGDPYFNYQWHLNNTGQSGGTVDADIDMPEAWELLPPKYTKRLAILDVGFELTHSDMDQDYFMWKYDFVGDDINDVIPDTDPSPGCYGSSQYCYHGTAMLGLISPIIDNGVGLAGIMDSIAIIPLKIYDNYGNSLPLYAQQALQYCMTSPHNATVLCCPWSINMDDDIAISQILHELYNYGHPMFFAAGNVSGNYVKYPACSPWVMSVSATDHNDNIKYSYKPGRDSVDIRAPGVDLWSFDLSGDAGLNPAADFCNWDDNYFCHYTGSSCATAIVSALAVKLLATRDDIIPPFSPPGGLYNLLKKTANDLGDEGYDISYGYGRVNAMRAMVALLHGDVNHDFEINVSDAIYIISYIFTGGPAPDPYVTLANANCDQSVNISDAVYIINYIFAGGDRPKICYKNLPE